MGVQLKYPQTSHDSREHSDRMQVLHAGLTITQFPKRGAQSNNTTSPSCNSWHYCTFEKLTANQHHQQNPFWIYVQTENNAGNIHPHKTLSVGEKLTHHPHYGEVVNPDISLVIRIFMSHNDSCYWENEKWGLRGNRRSGCGTNRDLSRANYSVHPNFIF